MKNLITLLFVTILGCHERGTRENPILLYDTANDCCHEVWYKRDPGSSGALNLNAWDNLIKVKDKEIDSLKKIISTIPIIIYDTIDVCNPDPVKSIPDGYEQDRKEAQKYFDKWDAMNMRRICGCPQKGDSPEKMEELINKYLSFKSVQHDQKIFDKETAEYKKQICK